MFVQSFGHVEPLSTLFADVWHLSCVRALVILQQRQRFAGFAALRAGVPKQAEVSLFMSGELGRPLEGLFADWTLEGFLISVGPLVGHEIRGVCKVAVTHVTCKKGVFQNALFVFYRMFQLLVSVFALVIAEDDVAFDAVQRELRGCEKT